MSPAGAPGTKSRWANICQVHMVCRRDGFVIFQSVEARMKGDRQDQMDDIVTSQGHRVQPPATCTQRPCVLRRARSWRGAWELERGAGAGEGTRPVPALPSTFVLTPGPGHAVGTTQVNRSGVWGCPGWPRSLPRGRAGALLSLTGQLGVRPQAPILSSGPIRVQASVSWFSIHTPSSAKHPTTCRFPWGP